MENIVWGTCWFNEDVEDLINFYNNSIKSLKELGYKIVPVIFSAQFNSRDEEIEYIKSKVIGVKVIRNNVDVFPNKNYGVAKIVKYAKEKNIKYTAIVDSDWNLKRNFNFVNNIMSALKDGNNDLIIPNIGNASGRSNLLIGRSVINLFYPEYKDVIKSAFPGSILGITEKMYELVSSPTYHYDWGGEWDLISLAISKNMKVSSSEVEVENVRHRPNKSKACDSFQIWRAIMSNPDVIERFKYVKDYEEGILYHTDLAEDVLACEDDILSVIEVVEKHATSETVRQLLIMILYPLAYLMRKIKEVPVINNSKLPPYEKKELMKYAELAILCVQKSLVNCDIKKLHNNCFLIKGEYLSEWTFELKRDLFEEEVIVDEV